MGLKEWLVPQDKLFFDLITDQSKTVLMGADALADLTRNFTDIAEKRGKLKKIEKDGDEKAKVIYQRLNKIFLTPIDREDISKLASVLDDVLDLTYSVANRLHFYGFKQVTPPMIELADIAVKSVKEVDKILSGLRKISDHQVEAGAIELDKFENDADELLNTSVAELFKSSNVIEVIKIKEIYEHFELITDKCEDLSDVIRDIMIKRS